MKRKIYIVNYSFGEYEDLRIFTQFATSSKERAYKWVLRYNNIMKYYKSYYMKYEDGDKNFSWIKDEYLHYFDRWIMLKDFNNAYVDCIELR